MSIRFKNAAGITTAANSVVATGVNKASVSFRLKINSPPVFTNNVRFIQAQAFQLWWYKAGVTPDLIQCNFTWYTTAANPILLPIFNVNVVNHFVATFDKDDPSSQAVYVNGVKSLMTNPQAAPLRGGSSPLYSGFTADNAADQYDYELEGLFFLNDYVLSRSDVLRLGDGVDPTTIGTSATWRGFWPLTGTKDAVPAIGDAGLANAIDGSLPYKPYIGPTTPGTSLKYGDPMPFVSQADYETPVVCSSGEAVRFGTYLATTGAKIPVTAGSITTMPTIRIDGGDPITLVDPFYSGTHAGAVLYIPGGLVVAKGASVTMSAVEGWFSTPVGVGSGMTDAPIVNRSGKPIYGDTPMRVAVGENHSSGPTYWHFERGFKNFALSMPVAPPATTRADQTLNVNWAGLLVSTEFPTPFDRTGTPKMLGPWVVSYDDNDPANPTNIFLYCANGQLGPIPELTAYRNDGVAGVGKARVYDVQKHIWTYVLQGGCSATATVLTLDTVTHVTGASAGANEQWIKIDDEYMDITAVNVPAKQVTVTRGIFGSTPAAHLDKAVGTASFFTPFYGLSLNVSNPTTGVPNYKNLVVFSPQDWTLPDTPGPVTVDRSPASMKGVSKFVADSTIPGTGPIRHMDSTMGGFDVTAEPEHMRLDTDLYPSRNVKVNPLFHVTSSRPVTPTNCPYIYSPIRAKNAEMFPVTLGADVATAPPAGTIETITIPDAATAKVFYPLRLKFPSGEIVRVLGVDGDQVRVVRGAERTTPATQAAGPILGLYRTPITSPSQYESTNTAYVEITTQEPHGIWPGVWMGTQSCTDLSVLARFDVTLTADVTTTTQTVFQVSVDADHAIYLALNLEIVFGTEQVVISSVAPTGGGYAITVARAARATTAATHASGTVGKARSGGVFCVSNDGTKHGWSGQIGWAEFFQLTGPNTLIAPYFVAGFGQNAQHVGVQTWDPTPVVVAGVDTASISLSAPRAAYSYEHAARVTELADGSDHWLNIPYCTTNDGVDAIALAIRDILTPGKHRVFVELANEVWNSGLPWNGNMRLASALSGYADTIDFWVARSGGVADRVRAIFEEVGRGSEVYTVLAWQQGGLGYPLGRARALGVDVDVCSTAPYFRPGNTAAHIAAWNRSTDAQCIDTWLFDVEYDMANIGAKLAADGLSRRTHEAATGRPLLFVHYEGGLDSCTPTPASSIVNGVARNIDQMYHPNRYFAEYDFPFVLNRLGGTDGIALFNHCQTPFAEGGTPPTYSSLWGLTEWHGQQAGKGDGSDGKADNRLCLVTPGQAHTKHPTVNQDETNVSVRLQAVLDYKTAFAAQNSPSDPGGGPGTGTGGDPGNGTGVGVSRRPSKWFPRSNFRAY